MIAYTSRGGGAGPPNYERGTMTPIVNGSLETVEKTGRIEETVTVAAFRVCPVVRTAQVVYTIGQLPPLAAASEADAEAYVGTVGTYLKKTTVFDFAPAASTASTTSPTA